MVSFSLKFSIEDDEGEENQDIYISIFIVLPFFFFLTFQEFKGKIIIIIIIMFYKFKIERSTNSWIVELVRVPTDITTLIIIYIVPPFPSSRQNELHGHMMLFNLI